MRAASPAAGSPPPANGVWKLAEQGPHTLLRGPHPLPKAQLTTKWQPVGPQVGDNEQAFGHMLAEQGPHPVLRGPHPLAKAQLGKWQVGPHVGDTEQKLHVGDPEQGPQVGDNEQANGHITLAKGAHPLSGLQLGKLHDPISHWVPKVQALDIKVQPWRAFGSNTWIMRSLILNAGMEPSMSPRIQYQSAGFGISPDGRRNFSASVSYYSRIIVVSNKCG